MIVYGSGQATLYVIVQNHGCHNTHHRLLLHNCFSKPGLVNLSYGVMSLMLTIDVSCFAVYSEDLSEGLKEERERDKETSNIDNAQCHFFVVVGIFIMVAMC